MLKSLYGYLTNSTKTTESPQIWQPFQWVCSFSVCLTDLLSSSSINDLSQTLISILTKRCNAFNPKKIRHRVTAGPVETVGSWTRRRNTSLCPHSATVRPENCSWVFLFYCWISANQQAWPYPVLLPLRKLVSVWTAVVWSDVQRVSSASSAERGRGWRLWSGC